MLNNIIHNYNAVHKIKYKTTGQMRFNLVTLKSACSANSAMNR